jgi:hypothetical protein
VPSDPIPSKPALYADELRTDGRVSLAGSTILASTVDGAIRMIGARIGGELDCSGATITNPSGTALHGEHLQVAGNLSLRAGFTADGAVSWARCDWPRHTSAATWTALAPSSATPLAPRYGPEGPSG